MPEYLSLGLTTWIFLAVVAVTILSSILAEEIALTDTLEDITLVYKFVISIYYISGEDFIHYSNYIKPLPILTNNF